MALTALFRTAFLQICLQAAQFLVNAAACPCRIFLAGRIESPVIGSGLNARGDYAAWEAAIFKGMSLLFPEATEDEWHDRESLSSNVAPITRARLILLSHNACEVELLCGEGDKLLTALKPISDSVFASCRNETSAEDESNCKCVTQTSEWTTPLLGQVNLLRQYCATESADFEGRCSTSQGEIDGVSASTTTCKGEEFNKVYQRICDPKSSAVFDHCQRSRRQCKLTDFSIVATGTSHYDLRMKESL